MPDQPKMSQADAHYRESDKVRCCGLCPYFDSKDASCDVTDGKISCFGLCDQYVRQSNPFQGGEVGIGDLAAAEDSESPAENAAPGDAAEDAQQPPPAPPMPGPPMPPPGVMIGRKTYMQ